MERTMEIDGRLVSVETGEAVFLDGPVLRQYQIDAVNAVRNAITENCRRIVMVSPTGSGKSIIIAEIIRLALEKGNTVLWLVHRRNLVTQMKETLESFGIIPGIIMAGEESDTCRKVQIGTYQTYQRRIQLENSNFFIDAKLLLIDEAHRSLSKGYTDIIKLYKDSIVIGCTATPVRSDNRPMGSIYQKIVDVISVQSLTDDGFLAKARYFAAPIDVSDVPIARGDYEVKALDKKTNNAKIVGDIVQNWLRIAENRPTIVFCVTVRHSIHICEEFNRRGVKALHLDARSTDEEREDAFRQMENGDITVLCNVALYQEGMDCPNISCVVIARPTKSLGLYRQCAGRGLRKKTHGGDCIAHGTKILTDSGEVEIQNITLDHRLWDGVSFVDHGGILYKGVKEVIRYQGLTATKNHMVMTNDGWKSFSEAACRGMRIVETGNGRNEIRFNGDNIDKDRGEMGSAEGSRCLREVRQGFYEPLSQYEEKKKHKSVSVLQHEEKNGCSEVVVSTDTRATGQMRKPQQSKIYGLWRKGSEILVRFCSRSVGVDLRKHWSSEKQEDATRQRKQCWKLRTWKSSMGDSCTKHEQFEKDKRGTEDEVHRIQKATPFSEVFRQYHANPDVQGIDGRRDMHEVGEPFTWSEEVWDILNVGALHRFTANGLLVHNCYILDHGGVIEEHGLLTDEVEWTLEGKEKAWKEKKKPEKKPSVCRCPGCSAVFEGLKVCPDCGSELKTFGKKIDIIDADLQEIGKKKKMSAADKRRWFGMCRYYQKQKGYSSGWASHKYKSKTGVWPRGMDDVSPIPPDQSFKNHILHEQIAYAKRKQA